MDEAKHGGSVTGWIRALKEGDEAAAQQILDRYFDQIVRIARRRIQGSSLEGADEEDVAIEAFESVFRAAADGRLHSLQDRDELWGLLIVTAYRKFCDYWRKQTAQKRSGREDKNVSPAKTPATRLSRSADLEDIAVEKLTGDILAAIADQHRFLMEKLQAKGGQLVEIATMILLGYTNREIAKQLACSERRIERKRRLIRDLWKHAVGDQA